MMNEEPRDAGLLIGLHKLAAQNGDGLVPELYALLTSRTAVADANNVIEFPHAPQKARDADRNSGEAGRGETSRVLALHR